MGSEQLASTIRCRLGKTGAPLGLDLRLTNLTSVGRHDRVVKVEPSSTCHLLNGLISNISSVFNVKLVCFEINTPPA